jgi:predicted nucleotidyltransferase
MRLSSQQREEIVQTFLEVFEQGQLWLFGSRVDDSKRGGDIDLYVEPHSQDNLAEKRITFLARVKRRIGDQKIDLVVAHTPSRAIDVAARQTGVLLCRNT